MQITTKNIDQRISRNFHVAKFCAIFLVIIGHFFKDKEILWVPAAIGLLIFSYSSGYFTFLKYNGDFNKKSYWGKKVERLGINFIVINLFLLILFLIQGRSGIWTWHTLINITGLNGFLNWFRVPNLSPFGAGMWFFTLLLIFYLFYPYLEITNRKKVISILSVITTILVLFYLNTLIEYGHALWLTACGFFMGIFFARNNFRLSNWLNIVLFIVILIFTFYFNYVIKIKDYNFFFILLLAVFTVFLIESLEIPNYIVVLSTFFSAALLEIYLLHPYLLIQPAKSELINFILSIGLIVFISKMLQLISNEIIRKRLIYKRFS